MSIDWEELLGCDGDDMEDAYEADVEYETAMFDYLDYDDE